MGLMKRLRSYMSGHLLSEINPEALIRWIWILAPVLPWPAATEWSTFWRDASCFCHRRQFQPPSHLWHSKLQVGLGHVSCSQKEFDSTRRDSEALCNRNHSRCKSLKLIVFQGGFMVYHGFWLVSIVLLVENTTKLYPGPTIQSRPCRP